VEKFSSQSRVTPRSRTAEENVRRGKAADKAASYRELSKLFEQCSLARKTAKCNYMYVVPVPQRLFHCCVKSDGGH